MQSVTHGGERRDKCQRGLESHFAHHNYPIVEFLIGMNRQLIIDLKEGSFRAPVTGWAEICAIKKVVYSSSIHF
jgi:hypothetical protein